LGASAAALAVDRRVGANHIRHQGGRRPRPPKLAIEKGASLRMLRPGALRAGRRGRVPRQCRQVHQGDRGRVKVDFVGWEDINQQTAVTSNSGAGPDIIIGFSDAPHIYIDKLVELTDVAGLSRQALWRAGQPLRRNTASRNKSDAWIGIAIRRHRRPPDLPQIRSAIGRLRQGSGRSRRILDLCRKLQKAGKPAGFALGNARGDGNGLPTGAVVAQRLPAR